MCVCCPVVGPRVLVLPSWYGPPLGPQLHAMQRGAPVCVDMTNHDS